MEAVGGLVFLLLLLSLSVIWILALVHAVRVPDERFRTGSKLLWVLLIAITHVVGAAIYWAVGRPRTA